MSTDIERLKQKLINSKLPYELRAKAERLISRLTVLEKLGGYNLKDYEVIGNYVDWITRIPFNQITKDNQEFASVKEILDRNHYGLESVKEVIAE